MVTSSARRSSVILLAEAQAPNEKWIFDTQTRSNSGLANSIG
jgi:hypothetical protein